MKQLTRASNLSFDLTGKHFKSRELTFLKQLDTSTLQTGLCETEHQRDCTHASFCK